MGDDAYVPMKLKFGLEEYRMHQFIVARQFICCSWPSCRFCNDWESLTVEFFENVTGGLISDTM